jgi:hypothetical protein
MNVQNLANLQHGDVLEKLKMQVRDIKVNLMDPSTFPTYSMSAAQMPSTAGSYPFTLPNPPQKLDTRDPGSNSSTSSETSNSSQQNNNGWSFEEQFKQVRQVNSVAISMTRKFSDQISSPAAFNFVSASLLREQTIQLVAQ